MTSVTDARLIVWHSVSTLRDSLSYFSPLLLGAAMVPGSFLLHVDTMMTYPVSRYKRQGQVVQRVYEWLLEAAVTPKH